MKTYTAQVTTEHGIYEYEAPADWRIDITYRDDGSVCILALESTGDYLVLGEHASGAWKAAVLGVQEGELEEVH